MPPRRIGELGTAAFPLARRIEVGRVEHGASGLEANVDERARFRHCVSRRAKRGPLPPKVPRSSIRGL
jgi:hypothetical protein